MSETSSIRYNWLDVFKAISMFFIIFSHLGGEGKLAPFVFSFMVHSFFFAGGLTASRNINSPVKEFVFSRFMRLMVPYFSFGILNIILTMIISPFDGIMPIITEFKTLLYGNRLTLFAVTLWFIPCLFILSIIYFFICKLLKRKWQRLVFCALLSLTFRIFSEGNVLPWGIDNAVRYSVYYAAGDCFAEFFNTLSQDTSLFFKKLWLPLLALASTACAFLQYQYGYMYFPSLFGFEETYMVLVISGAFQAFNGIFLISLVSIALQNIKFLQTAGKETLLICCMQRPVDKLVYAFTSLFGLTLNADTAMNCLALAAIFIVVSVKLAKPVHQYFPYLLGEKQK